MRSATRQLQTNCLHGCAFQYKVGAHPTGGVSIILAEHTCSDYDDWHDNLFLPIMHGEMRDAIGGELDDAIKNSVVRCIAARGATEATKDSALVAIILNDEGLPAARAFHEALESGATEALKAMRDSGHFVDVAATGRLKRTYFRSQHYRVPTDATSPPIDSDCKGKAMLYAGAAVPGSYDEWVPVLTSEAELDFLERFNFVGSSYGQVSASTMDDFAGKDGTLVCGLHIVPHALEARDIREAFYKDKMEDKHADFLASKITISDTYIVTTDERTGVPAGGL
jgi:hypothetical protein